MKRLALLGLLVVTACSAGGPASSAEAPPAGKIWFGESFDRGTLALTARLTSIKVGSPFVMLVNVGKSVTVADLRARTIVNGKFRADQSIKSSTKGAIFGLEGQRIGSAGEWRYEMIDKAGNVLASGTITVT
jgi:hypothetical protein